MSDVKVNHHLIIECMRSCIGSLSNTFRNLAKRAAESRGVAKLAQVSAGVSSRGHPSYGIGKNLRLHVTVCYQTGFSRVTFSLGTPAPPLTPLTVTPPCPTELVVSTVLGGAQGPA